MSDSRSELCSPVRVGDLERNGTERKGSTSTAGLRETSSHAPRERARKACAWRRCTQPTAPGSVMFCAEHEQQWHDHKTSFEAESTDRQFVRWVYNRPEDDRMPYLPASLEPKRRRTKDYEQPPVNRVLDALLRAGCTYRSSAQVDSWGATCPTHDDHAPSLQVTRNADGSVWLKCWAGCSKEGILDALGLEWGDLFESSQHDPGAAGAPRLRPLLPPHLRAAMEEMIRLDDERRAA